MKDRQPYPGKEGMVKLTLTDGKVLEGKLEMADEAYEPGDPLNKATLLKDATAALFGLGTDAVPDDVLNFIGAFMQGQYTEYEITVKADNWSGDASTGYTNLVIGEAMNAIDKIIFVSPVYSADQETRVQQYKSVACVNAVSVLPSNVVTVTAFAKKPPYDFNLKLLLVDRL